MFSLSSSTSLNSPRWTCYYFLAWSSPHKSSQFSSGIQTYPEYFSPWSSPSTLSLSLLFHLPDSFPPGGSVTIFLHDRLRTNLGFLQGSKLALYIALPDHLLPLLSPSFSTSLNSPQVDLLTLSCIIFLTHLSSLIFSVFFNGLNLVFMIVS